MSSSNISSFCSSGSASINYPREARAAQSGRCWGVLEGRTADAFAECCPFQALSISTRRGVGGIPSISNETMEFNCTYLACTVNNSAAFTQMEDCMLQTPAGQVSINKTSYENMTRPYCQYEVYATNGGLRIQVESSWFGLQSLVVGLMAVAFVAGL